MFDQLNGSVPSRSFFHTGLPAIQSKTLISINWSKRICFTPVSSKPYDIHPSCNSGIRLITLRNTSHPALFVITRKRSCKDGDRHNALLFISFFFLKQNIICKNQQKQSTQAHSGQWQFYHPSATVDHHIVVSVVCATCRIK